MAATVTWSSTSPLQRGASLLADDSHHVQEALGAGTRLDEFEIVHVLGAGGFGIVYLAFDHVLQRQVAIKEYLPTTLASRVADGDVRPRSDALGETFARGLESFCNEARLLASFDHPSLVKVHRFWRAHGTAYMAMPYYLGKTLKQTRSEMQRAPDGAWLLALVEPLLGALDALHREGVYHRDIAPDNILIQPDGRPVLLDFGSARRVVGDGTQTLTAILKPNFAPVEQYADEVGMRQGPWTDLYALGATFQFMLTSKPPTPAVMRAVRDAMPMLARQGEVTYPGVQASFLSAMDWMLAVAPDERPQSVEALRSVLQGQAAPPAMRRGAHWAARQQQASEPVDAVVTSDLAPLGDTLRTTLDAAAARASGRPWLIAAGLLVMAVAVTVGWLAKPPMATPMPEAQPVAAVPPAASAALIAAPASEVARSVPAAAKRVTATPTRVKTEQPVATTLPLAAPRAPATGESPAQACAGLNVFAHAACVSRLCRQPGSANDTECVAAKRVEEQRQQRMDH